MQCAINNGIVIDPKNKIFSKLNLGIENGNIVEISTEELNAEQEINAEGCVVSPGFVDIHMHEDPYNYQKKEFEISIFDCMLRMGVTSAIGGNCGVGPDKPNLYLKAIDKQKIPINLGLFLPHEFLRKEVGEDDKYENAKTKHIKKMQEITEHYLKQGFIGVSFGIRYIPGITKDELMAISKPVQKYGGLISAHIRDDAAEVISAAEELINVGIKLNIPVQISHIGSMAAFGQMSKLLSLIDYYKAKGLDISADCYPYNAFSTGIGETTYDQGFLNRYNTNYSSIEIAEGKYKGKRCDEKLFKKLRKDSPDLITIAHVMKQEEVELAIAHPNVMIASDGFMHNFEGHPRASGTFPRIISKYVKEKNVLSLFGAISKMTYLPAKRVGVDKGSIGIGDDADIVIFNFDEITDKATFENPTEPPKGIKYVLIKGEVVCENSKIRNRKLGKSLKNKGSR